MESTDCPQRQRRYSARAVTRFAWEKHENRPHRCSAEMPLP